MTTGEGNVPESIPPHWATAHDLWLDVERALPAETTPELREQLEKDCYGLFERAFDQSRLETQLSMSGEWGPEFVVEMVRRTVELGSRQVFNTLLAELLQLRVEVAVLKTKVRRLEDERG